MRESELLFYGGVGEGVHHGVMVTVGEGVHDGVTVTVEEGVFDGVMVTVGEAVRDGVMVTVAVAVEVDVIVGVQSVVGQGEGVGVFGTFVAGGFEVLVGVRLGTKRPKLVFVAEGAEVNVALFP